MTTEAGIIQALVDRETAAWNAQDAEALVSLFHPDMVRPWPPDGTAHDPVTWVMPMGRYDRARWKASWEQLFRECELVHNHRTTVRIEVTEQRDGGFAIVDVDTLWRRRSDGAPFQWFGRACKGYTKVGSEWLLIYHTCRTTMMSASESLVFGGFHRTCPLVSPSRTKNVVTIISASDHEDQCRLVEPYVAHASVSTMRHMRARGDGIKVEDARDRLSSPPREC